MGSSETLSADLLIVGAGPTGLYAAYYAGFRGLSTVIVDSLPEAGGQITAMYREKMIHDVAGVPSVRGRELGNAAVEQASQWNPTFLPHPPADQPTPGDASLVGGPDS